MQISMANNFFPRTTFTADSLNFINFDELQKIDVKLKFNGTTASFGVIKVESFIFPLVICCRVLFKSSSEQEGRI